MTAESSAAAEDVGSLVDVLTDPQRLAAVRRLLGVGVESSALDDLAALAAEMLAAPNSQVSILDHDEQVIAAVAGEGASRGRGPASESLCTVTLRRQSPHVLPDARHEPDVAALPPVASGVVGSYLGVPLRAGTATLGALCVYDPEPRQWSDRDVAVLERLARSVVAELELRALTAELATSSTRLELALEAAAIGSYELEPVSGQLLWDRRLIDLFGYDPETFVPHLDSFSERVHVDDRARVSAAIEAALATDGELSLEYRIVRPDGETRWVTARGRTVRDEYGGQRLFGAAYDSTAVRTSRDQVARVLETMTDAFYSLDRDWRFTYVNAQAERLLLRSREDLLGRCLWQEFPDAVGTVFEAEYHRAVDTGQAVTFEAYYPPPLDGWYELRAWPTPEGLSVYFSDVTLRRQAEQERERAYAEARAASERLTLLSDFTRALVSTLEVDEALARLVGLVVPRLADWATVVLVDEHGQLRESLARHRDPERADDIQQVAALQAQVMGPESVTGKVLATGAPVLLSAADVAAARDRFVEDTGAAALLERLGVASALVVPLVAGGRVLGVLALVGDPEREPFTEDDLLTAQELGQRAGLAVENAQLYGRQRTAAEVLQRSLLAALPEPDHLHIVARYLPAGQEAQVGGDFYSALQQPDGSTVLAIGDVVGHDIGAAAAMGVVSHLLRGITYDTGAAPAEVLSRLDRALSGLRVDTMATAVVARIEEIEPGGDVRRLRWSNAGHPPPLLIQADGRVRVLESGNDLLLGVDAATDRRDGVTELAAGDTLLLYTDGLVERRDSPLEHGLARLRQAAATLADRPLDELCDEVLVRLLPTAPEDDVAMIAVRAHTHAKPRPAEAGPTTD